MKDQVELSANGGTSKGWRRVLAELTTQKMLWFVLVGVVGVLMALIVDGLVRDGCIDVPGYQSSGCGKGTSGVAREGTTGVFPTGAVVAFWHEGHISVLDLPDQCPDGWEPFEEGQGRFLVGAGKPSHPNYMEWQREDTKAMVPLSSYHPKEKGGEPKHTLTVPEMPAHQHPIGLEFPRENAVNNGIYDLGRETDRATGVTTGTAGGGEAHNNMPPYLALYFCKYVGDSSSGAGE